MKIKFLSSNCRITVIAVKEERILGKFEYVSGCGLTLKQSEV